MPPSGIYSRQSKDIRGKARAHIARLRVERLQRKRDSQGARFSDDTFPSRSDSRASNDDAFLIQPPVSDQPESRSQPDVASAPTAFSNQKEDSTEALPEQQEPKAETAFGEPAHVSDTLTIINDPETDVPELSTVLEQPVEQANEVDTSSPNAEVPLELEQKSNLYELPGAGSGLVWMLNKCGINSLSDLAEADKDSLSRDLGLVAKILDVGYWIEFAADQSTPS